MDIKFSKTERGFTLVEFRDKYGIAGSIQKSSLATEDAIWIGCNDPSPRRLIPGSGWTPEPLPPGTICDTRLHLAQDQVAALLPILQHFAETGELPAAEPGAERSE